MTEQISGQLHNELGDSESDRLVDHLLGMLHMKCMHHKERSAYHLQSLAWHPKVCNGRCRRWRQLPSLVCSGQQSLQP